MLSKIEEIADEKILYPKFSLIAENSLNGNRSETYGGFREYFDTKYH
jgi:hypothetical protein